MEDPRPGEFRESPNTVCVIGLEISQVFFFFSVFLGPFLKLMKIPRLGVSSELQLPASTTATATSDLSYVYSLHCSL